LLKEDGGGVTSGETAVSTGYPSSTTSPMMQSGSLTGTMFIQQTASPQQTTGPQETTSPQETIVRPIPQTIPGNIQFNTAPFSYLGLTYAQVKQKYGEPIDESNSLDFGRWTKFENGLTYIWHNAQNTYTDSGDLRPVKDDAPCISIQISMADLFPDLPFPVTSSALTGFLEKEYPVRQLYTSANAKSGGFSTYLEYEKNILIDLYTYSPTTEEIETGNCYLHAPPNVLNECGCSNKCQPPDYELADYVVFDEETIIWISTPYVPELSVKQIEQEIGSDDLVEILFYVMEHSQTMEVLCWYTKGEFQYYIEGEKNEHTVDLTGYRQEFRDWLNSLNIKELKNFDGYTSVREKWVFDFSGLKFEYLITNAGCTVYIEVPYNKFTGEGGTTNWYRASVTDIPDFMSW